MRSGAVVAHFGKKRTSEVSCGHAIGVSWRCRFSREFVLYELLRKGPAIANLCRIPNELQRRARAQFGELGSKVASLNKAGVSFTMYLLYCDETNLEERGGDFFTYGGLAIPGEVAQTMSQEIDEIRTKFGVPRNFRLKFNPGPNHLNHENFIALKQSIIESAARHKTTLFISLILHDIATSPADARRNEINRVCYHFDCFLNRRKSSGLVLIDRFDDKAIDAHLAEKFSIGITGMPYTKEMRLSNIVGFHYSAIGQSNFASVVDILLGTLRFSINGFTRNDPNARETAKKVIPLLSPMFFREEGRTTVSELGVFFSPKVIRSDKFRAVYEGMKDFFAECGVVLEQTITGAHD